MQLELELRANGSYALRLDGATWLESGATFFTAGGAAYSSASSSSCQPSARWRRRWGTCRSPSLWPRRTWRGTTSAAETRAAGLGSIHWPGALLAPGWNLPVYGAQLPLKKSRFDQWDCADMGAVSNARRREEDTGKRTFPTVARYFPGVRGGV